MTTSQAEEKYTWLGQGIWSYLTTLGHRTKLFTLNLVNLIPKKNTQKKKFKRI